MSDAERIEYLPVNYCIFPNTFVLYKEIPVQVLILFIEANNDVKSLYRII